MQRGEIMGWPIVLAVIISFAILFGAGQISDNAAIAVGNFIPLLGIMMFIFFEAFDRTFIKSKKVRRNVQCRK